MKYYLIQDGCGGEKIIQPTDMPKVNKLSKEMVEAAIKIGYTKEEAEVYRWKILKEIEYPKK